MRRPREGRVLVQREVSPPLVIISQEKWERASKGPFIPDDYVIETLPPEGADQALHKWILPRRTRRGDRFLSAKRRQEATEVGP